MRAPLLSFAAILLTFALADRSALAQVASHSPGPCDAGAGRRRTARPARRHRWNDLEQNGRQADGRGTRGSHAERRALRQAGVRAIHESRELPAHPRPMARDSQSASTSCSRKTPAWAASSSPVARIRSKSSRISSTSRFAPRSRWWWSARCATRARSATKGPPTCSKPSESRRNHRRQAAASWSS